jgi:hypothetical protein
MIYESESKVSGLMSSVFKGDCIPLPLPLRAPLRALPACVPCSPPGSGGVRVKGSGFRV